jgi:hypothetical protein
MMAYILEETMRKPKWNVLILFSALAVAFLGARANAAPKSGQQSQNEQAAKKETAQDSTIYRVSYKVNEVENGKTINSRSYTLMAKTDSTATVRIGSRVPYLVEKDTPSYMNVSMNIDCNVSKQEGNLVINTKLDMTTLEGSRPAAGLGSYPVIGTFQLQNSAAATLGKSAFVGAAEDVASNRHYEIEVTVTEAK